METASVTIAVALIGVIAGSVTALLSFLGKKQENKTTGWDQLNEALQADNKIWREEVAQLRIQLDAKIIEVSHLSVELEAMKRALDRQIKKVSDVDSGPQTG